MKRWLLPLGALLLACPAILAEYRFQVPENRCVVTANKDASITIQYAITFANEGQPIDIIDVGLPDSNYDIGEVRADLDGAPMTDIRPSTAVTYGVEVHLGDKTIPAGSKGTLHLTARSKDRVFQDDEDKAYASFEFSPTWYGAEYTSGTTRLVCEFVFPESVGPEEPRYHKTAFTASRVEKGRVVYTWEIPEASPSSQYTFGASFPARVMDRLAEKPKGPGPIAIFFGAIFNLIGQSVPCWCFAFFIGIFVFSFISNRRRRMKYLPPSVGMEGTEVRRGLTVPEVAVLMEEKVDKVMSLLLFGMIRKGLVKVVSRQPMKMELLPGKEPASTYETEFAKAIKDDGKLDEGEAAKVMTDLIKRVQEKMKGFSRKKSVVYYKEIMRKAWDQVGQEDYSQAFEWLLLDKDFDRTATARYPSGTMPLPGWWVPFYTGRPGGPWVGGSGASAGGQGVVASANTIATSMESFGHDLVNSVPGLATKVTEKTNPVPVSSGGGGRSGGGCACACACAGCACACAGGGR